MMKDDYEPIYVTEDVVELMQPIPADLEKLLRNEIRRHHGLLIDILRDRSLDVRYRVRLGCFGLPEYLAKCYVCDIASNMYTSWEEDAVLDYMLQAEHPQRFLLVAVDEEMSKKFPMFYAVLTAQTKPRQSAWELSLAWCGDADSQWHRALETMQKRVEP